MEAVAVVAVVAAALPVSASAAKEGEGEGEVEVEVDAETKEMGEAVPRTGHATNQAWASSGPPHAAQSPRRAP